MKIELRLFASLARYTPDKPGSLDNCIMEIAEGSTIIDILRRLEVPLDKVRVIFLNGLHVTGDEVLKEGDRVGLFPPVAGG